MHPSQKRAVILSLRRISICFLSPPRVLCVAGLGSQPVAPRGTQTVGGVASPPPPARLSRRLGSQAQNDRLFGPLPRGMTTPMSPLISARWYETRKTGGPRDTRRARKGRRSGTPVAPVWMIRSHSLRRGSRQTGSNRRPADYKSAALPTELYRQTEFPRLWNGVIIPAREWAASCFTRHQQSRPREPRRSTVTASDPPRSSQTAPAPPPSPR